MNQFGIEGKDNDFGEVFGVRYDSLCFTTWWCWKKARDAMRLLTPSPKMTSC